MCHIKTPLKKLKFSIKMLSKHISCCCVFFRQAMKYHVTAICNRARTTEYENKEERERKKHIVWLCMYTRLVRACFNVRRLL